ncbi:MAG: BACON domain-containing protein [Alistipes sp.]|nr:BACON domain-containing protein [Alistipes sp.]
MKKLFYLLLCLPLAFAACTEPDTPGVENKEYDLKVTSETILNFEAEGGKGVIAYTLEEKTRFSPVGQPVVEAFCEATWVSELTVAENITFQVAANEADARETKIVVTYGEQQVEVAVKQEAKAEEPVNDVVFEAQVLTGEYYGDYYTPNAGNYYIFFSDYGFDEEGSILTNSIYYQLDLYGELYEGEAVNGCIPLPAGTYTLDADDTMAVGTIGYSYSCYMKTNSSEIEVEVYFDEAVLVVEEDGSCTLTAVVEGVKHIVTFNGESSIADRREVNTGGDNVEMEAGYAYATYYGDQYSPGVADNFYFFLSDKGFDADGWELPNATYYRFDLFSDIVNPEDGLAIPYGTYTIDNGSSEPFTIGAQYSAYYIMDAEGWDYAVSSGITSGTVTISEDGVVADLMIAGAHHVVTFSGDILVTDASSGGGEGGGGEGPYSTLWEDYRCNFDDHTLYYAYYSDYYEVGYMNWTFAVMPNDGEGDFVQFDVLAGADSTTNFFGEYAINDSFEAYTSYTGYIDWDGYMVGAWYYTEDGYTMAPFVDGTMSVVDNGDGTVTVEFDVYDDCDNNITGSWTGAMLSADELSTRAADIKKAEVKSVEAPVKRAIEVKKRDISKF